MALRKRSESLSELPFRSPPEGTEKLHCVHYPPAKPASFFSWPPTSLPNPPKREFLYWPPLDPFHFSTPLRLVPTLPFPLSPPKPSPLPSPPPSGSTHPVRNRTWPPKVGGSLRFPPPVNPKRPRPSLRILEPVLIDDPCFYQPPSRRSSSSRATPGQPCMCSLQSTRSNQEE